VFNPGTSRRANDRKLQVQRVQFPTESIKTEDQLNAFFFHREIAQPCEKRSVSFSPIDFLRGTIDTWKRRERARVLDWRRVGNDRSETDSTD
jgi:hypothetical protein